MRFPVAAAAAVFFLPALSRADVTGTIRDGAGKPVAGAFVRFVDAADATREADAFADASGKYAINLPAQSVSVTPRLRQAGTIRSGSLSIFDLRGRAVKDPGALKQGLYCYRAQVGAGVRSGLMLAGQGNLQVTQGADAERALGKSAAAGSYQVTVYGKGVYPLKTPGVSAADGDVKDFQLKAIAAWDSDRVILRNSLANSRFQIQKAKSARVAFLGGSITHNPGWRDSISAYLRQKYPQTAFDFINAGIPSVGVNMHAFRLERDVFFKGKVDLLFLESAVNDTVNSVPSIERTRAYEGIVRHALRDNPALDIVFMYFAADVFYPNVAAGKPIPQVVDYEKTAWQYEISSINLAQYVAEHYTWTQFGANVHPGALGQGLYYNGIKHLLEDAWGDSASSATAAAAHFLPARMQDSLCYYLGRLDTITHAQIVNGWKYVPVWKPTQGDVRDGFYDVPVLEATAPGDTLKLAFTGTAIGAVIPAGPDVGMLDFVIDGKIKGTLDQFTQWSSTLNIPWTLLFSGDLSMGPHVIKITTSAKKNAGSLGYASRIIRFVVNGPAN